mmetsp:Transcript_96260/g.233888  ORF Transcript_96260/g.233888 Transcript_96260/m.233888 type:complete len:204 (-) Transcript_96260:322-933(-)
MLPMLPKLFSMNGGNRTAVNEMPDAASAASIGLKWPPNTVSSSTPANGTDTHTMCDAPAVFAAVMAVAVSSARFSAAGTLMNRVPTSFRAPGSEAASLRSTLAVSTPANAASSLPFSPSGERQAARTLRPLADSAFTTPAPMLPVAPSTTMGAELPDPPAPPAADAAAASSGRNMAPTDAAHSLNVVDGRPNSASSCFESVAM